MNQPINLLLKLAAYGLSCGMLWSLVAPSASAEIRWIARQNSQSQLISQSFANRCQ